MLKQFPLELCEAVPATDLKLLTSTVLMSACYCNNLIANASFRISLLFACLSLCQDQVTCIQPEALGRVHKHAIIK